MEYLKAFLVGGIICVIGQIILSKTNISPARILVIFVTAGVLLTLIGIYEPLVDWGGAGATVPLTGFGYSLAKGVREAVSNDGIIGIFTGGVTATAGGITAAILFGYLVAVIFKPKTKK
ncbi:MAG: stage V sporulation protein AE [Eubacteriales bacterium]